jgi:cell division protein FtsI (penicillin-binding protein 3)
VIGRWARTRLILLSLIVCAGAGAVTARLVDLQLARSEEYSRKALGQQQRIRKVVPRRGDIIDRHGRELAVSIRVQDVAAHPGEVKNRKATARALAPILQEPARKLEARLSSDRPYVYLKRDVPPSVGRQVDAARLEGIVLEPHSLRIYPNGSLAAHALGFVGTDRTPLGGIELAFDKQIRGTDGKAIVLADAKESPFDHDVIAKAIPGETLELTLDLTVQHILEEELSFAARQARARAGSAVAMDPTTGEVLALASWPTFNPNDFADYSAEDRRDRVVVSAYEPGSTFKVITAAAALEKSLVRPQEVFYCGRGAFHIGRYTIRDHKSFADLTFTQVMARSSNVGAIKAGMRLGSEDFYDTIRRFGFGEKTGVGLPGEQGGLIRTPDSWSLLSQPSLSIGQEVLVTPLQMITAVSAVANRGVLIRPWIARGRRDLDGNLIERFQSPVPRQAISASTSRTLTKMLLEVVRTGTGRAAAVPGYEVAGKTGTAQKSSSDGSGYLADKHVASFAGYAPAWEPKLAAIFVLDEPRVEAYHGGDVAAPAFGRFAARTLPVLGAAPRRASERDPERVVVRRKRDAARPEAEWVTLHRSGSAAVSSPALPTRRRSAPASRDGVMPDLIGLTTREAVARLTRMGVSPVIEGQGRVVTQEPAAGQQLPADRKGCRLWLGHL